MIAVLALALVSRCSSCPAQRSFRYLLKGHTPVQSTVQQRPRCAFQYACCRDYIQVYFLFSAFVAPKDMLRGLRDSRNFGICYLMQCR